MIEHQNEEHSWQHIGNLSASDLSELRLQLKELQERLMSSLVDRSATLSPSELLELYDQLAGLQRRVVEPKPVDTSPVATDTEDSQDIVDDSNEQASNLEQVLLEPEEARRVLRNSESPDCGRDPSKTENVNGGRSSANIASRERREHDHLLLDRLLLENEVCREIFEAENEVYREIFEAENEVYREIFEAGHGKTNNSGTFSSESSGSGPLTTRVASNIWVYKILENMDIIAIAVGITAVFLARRNK